MSSGVEYPALIVSWGGGGGGVMPVISCPRGELKIALPRGVYAYLVE